MQKNLKIKKRKNFNFIMLLKLKNIFFIISEKHDNFQKVIERVFM